MVPERHNSPQRLIQNSRSHEPLPRILRRQNTDTLSTHTNNRDAILTLSKRHHRAILNRLHPLRQRPQREIPQRGRSSNRRPRTLLHLMRQEQLRKSHRLHRRHQRIKLRQTTNVRINPKNITRLSNPRRIPRSVQRNRQRTSRSHTSSNPRPHQRHINPLTPRRHNTRNRKIIHTRRNHDKQGTLLKQKKPHTGHQAVKVDQEWIKPQGLLARIALQLVHRVRGDVILLTVAHAECLPVYCCGAFARPRSHPNRGATYVSSRRTPM